MPVDFLSASMLALSWGATYLAHSTCLLAGVWIFLKLKRAASHSLRETLWKIALVGGVMTASVQMLLAPQGPFGDLTFAVELTRPEIVAAMPATSDLQNMTAAGGRNTSVTRRATHAEFEIRAVPVGSGHDFVIVTDPAAVESAPLAGERGDADPGSARVTLFPRQTTAWWISASDKIRRIPTALTLAIAVGVAGLAVVLGIARCVWQKFSLQQKLKRCAVVNSGPARRLLDELRRLVPSSPEVLLLATPDDPEPAAFGIRQWTIVLPERAVHDLPEDGLRALLAHELAHLVRGDSIWLCVSRTICSCLAFQPLNHLARREWQRAAEYLCDGWAVSRTGTPLALARCLAEVAGWRLSGRPSAALLPATGRKPGLADRIERLLAAADRSDTWMDLRERRRLVFFGASLLGLLVWCAPRVQLAVAETHPALRVASELVLETRTERGRFAEGDVASSISHAAKPQANGDDSTAADEFDGVTVSESTARLANGPQDLPSPSLAAMLEALDGDLSVLESELQQLGPLLSQKNVSPEAVRMAKGLRVEIVELRQRRNVLRAHWKKSVN